MRGICHRRSTSMYCTSGREDLQELCSLMPLQTYWLFQSYVQDLSSNPQSEAFRTCRRVHNKVQHIVFGLGDAARHTEKIKENALPVTMLASFIMASVAVPGLAKAVGPLAVAQARRPQPIDNTTISDATNQPKITRAHTVSATAANRPRRAVRERERVISLPDPRGSPELKSPEEPHQRPNLPPSRPTSSSGSTVTSPVKEALKRPLKHLDLNSLEARLSTSSLPLPDLKSPLPPRPPTPQSAGIRPSDSNLARRHSHHVKSALNKADMTLDQRARMLRSNYFRCQTQFLTALEDISNRLVVVPKPARLSALRGELGMLAQDLTDTVVLVDIPLICPPTLTDGSPARSKHHRIVRLNPAEATVLNSAEKVPYLLMIEVLRDDFTFDPESPDNQKLLPQLLEQGSRKRIFDLSESARAPSAARTPDPVAENAVDSVFEPSSGDLGNSPQLKPVDSTSSSKTSKASKPTPQRLPSLTTTVSTTSELITPRSSAASTSRSSSPGARSLRRMTIPTNPRNASVDQPDFSALAIHMRTASQMLSQLEATSGKRPKQEVAAIQAKIIASMQNLEEQNFESDDGRGPTFDQIMAKTSAQNMATSAELDEETSLDPAINASAGVERMENDFKTGGLQRKGDRDDPSAAVFGEAWEAKKERIRRSSPYGWMKNWDLVSVIVKTGSDLRQEAFACQLIDVCNKIWVDAGVKVWVQVMRILVTGESSGLVETITNGVSLHSIKRSLTLAAVEAGNNPRRRIATLRDHFAKAFGDTDSDAYKAGVDAFKRSLAAYSIISYILQLKDRHNGNILIDNEGHIIHIDFGFMLSNSPGSVGFEAAPFKLTHEYVEVLGGVGSPEWEDFKRLCKQAFQG